jgi:thiamine biosynthesis lipoprotein
MASTFRQEDLKTVTGFHFDTLCTISAYEEQGILEEAMGRCTYFNDLLSKTVEGSDVWRINHAEGARVAVSGHTVRILRAALEVGRDSGGAFNIALGTAVGLWNVMSADPAVPDAQELALALEKADLSAIEVDGEALTVRVPAGTVLDLGGIAKGYISDRIAEYLRERGLTKALLNFGGNVVSIGSRWDGKPWNVGLHHPDSAERDGIFAVLGSVDDCVVTSGAYERGFELDGVRYHHILDPRTGWPAELKLTSVTLVGQDAMLADALSTAIFIMDVEAGIELAGSYGYSVVLLDIAGSVRFTKGLPLTLAGKQAPR